MTEISPPFSNEFEVESSWLRRKLGFIIALVVLAAAGAGAYWYFTRDTSEPAPVTQQQTSAATTGRLVTSLSTTGTAASTLTSRLTFATAAKVTAVNAKLGEKVAAGQVLASLDATDLQRKLDSAAVSLNTAQLRLQDLLEPATGSELASAQAAVSSAKVQLANAEENLRKSAPGQDSDAILAADTAVSNAQSALTTAKNGVQNSWISLITAQRNYCTTDNHLVQVCYESDLPLSQARIDSLIAEVRNPATTAVGSAANSFISASTSYGNSLSGVTNAEKTLASAQEKRAALDQPPTALVQQQLLSAVQSANASVLSAEQKYSDLLKGPDTITLAQQQESVKSAQVAYETAKSAVDAVVLKAPFGGTITAVGISVGDNVSAATAAFTITNVDAVRVDLAVQEADFVGLAAGQYGTATFEALSGYTYVVRITAVNPTPTTTQGVVSYQVQAEVLSPAQLQDPATLQAAAQAVTNLSGGIAARLGPNGGPAGAGAANGTRPAGNFTPGAGAGQGGRPPAQGTPGAGRTPGAGFPGAGAGADQAGAGGALLQGLLNAPTPTPGMNATVVILKSVTESALLIPNNAIRTTGSTRSVTVKKDDGTTETRGIQTGATDGTNTIVTSGLTEGEVVVVGSATAAASGTTGTTGQQGNFPAGGFIPGGAGAQGGNTGATGGVR